MFDIRHYADTQPQLYLLLKAYSKDPLYSYVLPLSNNKIDILTFFGFDTSIEFDKLTEKNTFEYLCTSSILDPKHIQYTGGFKGPYAINKLHEKFNDYLKNKKYPKPTAYNEEYYTKKKNVRDTFKKNALAFFNKENEYNEYKSHRDILEKVYAKFDIIKNAKLDKDNFVDFERFVILHGVYKVSQMNENELYKLWSEFVAQNWSGLVVIGGSRHSY